MSDNNTGCGCGGQTSSECTTSERSFFIAEVEKSRANTCSETADCEFNVPFYDKTLVNSSFVVGAVGGTTPLSVCDNSRWTEGQWIYIPNAGRFQVTAKEGCSLIYVKNGCGSGEDAVALPGNAEPGKIFTGVQKLWLTSDPGCDDGPTNDYCTELLNAISDCEAPICKIFDPVDEEQDFRLVAASHIGEGSSLKSCLYKAWQIFVKTTTLCFPSLPQNTVEKVGDTPVQDVQWLPDDGCLVKRALPSGGAIDIYCGGVKKYLQVPNDFESKEYSLGIDDDGCPTFKEIEVEGCDIGQTRHPITINRILSLTSKTINTANRDQLVNFASIMPTIPDCAGDVAVEVNVRLRVTATLSNNFPTLSCKVIQDGVDVIVVSQHSQPSFHYDTNSLILKLDKSDPKLTFVCEREGATSGGTFSLLIDVLAFHY